jgi:predicted flavoprotein YhiN
MAAIRRPLRHSLDGTAASAQLSITFKPDDMQQFGRKVSGTETFIGSSGRVFPKAMKASPLLRAWLEAATGTGRERT